MHRQFRIFLTFHRLSNILYFSDAVVFSFLVRDRLLPVKEEGMKQLRSCNPGTWAFRNIRKIIVKLSYYDTRYDLTEKICLDIFINFEPGWPLKMTIQEGFLMLKRKKEKKKESNYILTIP